MRIHHGKHHTGYVAKLNEALAGNDELLAMDINDLMGNLNEVPGEIKTAVRNSGGGHANHSLFWKVMGVQTSEGSGREPQGKLAEAIKSSFGNFATFQEKFAAAALGRFGSGWAWLIIDGRKLAVVDTPNQDTPLMEGKTPILGIDVWEHAYYLKYQNRRADYIKAWWNVVNWNEVAKTLDAL